MCVCRCESWFRLNAGARNGQTHITKTTTVIKMEITMRSRFSGNRESGVVKTIAAIKPRMANFLRPIIIHEMGGVNDSVGT